MLQHELRWEPEVALLGSGEHERLARAAKARFVVFEVGDGQADEVAEMLREARLRRRRDHRRLDGPR